MSDRALLKLYDLDRAALKQLSAELREVRLPDTDTVKIEAS